MTTPGEASAALFDFLSVQRIKAPDFTDAVVSSLRVRVNLLEETVLQVDIRRQQLLSQNSEMTGHLAVMHEQLQELRQELQESRWQQQATQERLEELDTQHTAEV